MSKYLQAIKTLDLIQVAIFDFYLGGFVFFIIASIPLGLFTPTVTFFVIGVFVVITLVFLIGTFATKFRDKEQPFLKRIRQAVNDKKAILFASAIITMFIIILWIEADATTGILFGNVHDASLFSMLSKVISQNRMIPATLSPFESSGIIYPQGYTVILTFTSYIFNSGPENLILVLVPLFQALTIFGAYFMGKMLSGKMSYGFIFAFMFTFLSRWPKLLVWGTYAYVAAVPLFLIVLSLIFYSSRPQNQTSRSDIIRLFFLGLLIGYLGAIHAVFYEIIIAALFLLVIGKSILRRRLEIREFFNFFFVFVFSLIPVSIFLFRFVLSASIPGQNVGLPNDIVAPQLFSISENFNFIVESYFKLDWISPYPVLKVATEIFIISSIVLIFFSWKFGWLSKSKSLIKMTFFSFLGAALIILIGSRELGFNFLVSAINLSETTIALFISLIFLICIATATFYEQIFNHLRKRFPKIASMGIIVLLFFSIFSPFIYYTIFSDVQYCRGTYTFLSVATSDDYSLMMSMKDKLPINSIVLVNPNDAGSFIPTVAGYKVVLPFTGSRSSISYSNLSSLILEGNLNENAYSLMRHFNITHVFVGSRATDYNGPNDWNPLLFLGNPNFELVNKVGGSYLFAFVPENINVVFFDDFENPDRSYEGWEVLSSSTQNGTFTISISSDPLFKFDGNNSLKLESEANSNSISLNWFQRRIYLPNTQNANVSLSFYLSSPTSFKDFEGLTFIISEGNFSRQLFISTWLRSDAVELQNFYISRDYLRVSFPGFYEMNLSRLWFAKFNSTLPSSFLLQAELFNSDETVETFYIDAVGVSCGT
jgi:hypothetical protein